MISVSFDFRTSVERTISTPLLFNQFKCRDATREPLGYVCGTTETRLSQKAITTVLHPPRAWQEKRLKASVYKRPTLSSPALDQSFAFRRQTSRWRGNAVVPPSRDHIRFSGALSRCELLGENCTSWISEMQSCAAGFWPLTSTSSQRAWSSRTFSTRFWRPSRPSPLLQSF